MWNAPWGHRALHLLGLGQEGPGGAVELARPSVEVWPPKVELCDVTRAQPGSPQGGWPDSYKGVPPLGLHIRHQAAPNGCGSGPKERDMLFFPVKSACFIDLESINFSYILFSTSLMVVNCFSCINNLNSKV